MYKVIRTPMKGIESANPSYVSMKQETALIDNKGTMEYLTFPMLSKLDCVCHLFTTRLGGVSQGIFKSMNLSFTRNDDYNAVMENYRRVALALDAQMEDNVITLDNFVCTDQTHTTNIRIVTKADAGKGVTIKRDYTDVDGLITNEKGLVLATFYADCVPLYFVDPVKKVIGLSHSGWKGTSQRMGQCTIDKMKEAFGCRAEDIYVAIGPSICQECYEVSEDVADAFKQTFKKDEEIISDIMYQKKDGKYQLDLWKANYYILLQAGISRDKIQVTDICTCHNPDYLFSHRKSNGQRGNLGAFLCLR